MGTIAIRLVNAVLTERRWEHSEGLSGDFTEGIPGQCLR